MTLNQLAGVLPAFVFPTATALQVIRIVRQRSAAGVSVSSWTMFGVANVALYIYAERYTEWQSILGLLLTAVLDFAIVALALVGFREAKKPGHPVTETVDTDVHARDRAEADVTVGS